MEIGDCTTVLITGAQAIFRLLMYSPFRTSSSQGPLQRCLDGLDAPGSRSSWLLRIADCCMVSSSLIRLKGCLKDEHQRDAQQNDKNQWRKEVAFIGRMTPVAREPSQYHPT